MKLTKNLKALILLFIICFNAVESTYKNSMKLRKIRISRSSKTSKKSKDGEGSIMSTVFNYLKKELTDPENILYFVLGVLSVFWSSIEEFYHKFRPKVGILKTCISAAKISFKVVSESLDQKDDEDKELEKNHELLTFLAKMESKEKQKNYCEKVKREIDGVFDEAELKKNDRNYGPLDLLLLWWNQNGKKSFVSSQEYCDQVDILKKYRKQNLIEKYGSLQQYKQQCIYFKDLDCETMEVETGIIEFVSKAYKYFKYVHTVEKCIVKVLGESDFIQDTISDLLTGAAGFAANIFSFGAWGGIKGAYKIFKLASDLKKSVEKFRHDLPFNVGKIVGRGIEIAKSILLGKKKRRNNRK